MARSSPPVTPPPSQSRRDSVTAIYDQIGGAPSISAAVDLLYEKAIGDPNLAPISERWMWAT
jgi:truncated hemoglobin YjbI